MGAGQDYRKQECSDMQDVTDRHEVMVVGGGQAGLAMGYFLAQHGHDFVILEAADETAAAWRKRWDSLRLFTPARYSALPGLPFPGDPNHYPTRDEVASYLATYSHRFALPLRFGSRVKSLRNANGNYVLETDERGYEAQQVVVATGPFQAPRVPPIADSLGEGVVQLHSSEYRSPSDIPAGTVLVVGGGNSGFQIAEELSGSHQVHLAIGSGQTPLPQRMLGRDLFWYLEATGLIRKTQDSRIGKRLANEDTLIGYRPSTLASGSSSSSTHPRCRRLDRKFQRRHEARSEGRHLGHRLPTRPLVGRPPVFDEVGDVIHQRGVTDSPGLYFIGLPWQHTRGSSLLGFVKDDADHLARQIAAFRPWSPRGSDERRPHAREADFHPCNHRRG